MGILSWIVLGGLAGWISTMLMKQDAKYGIIGNIIIGIVGAFIGGFVMSLLGFGNVTGFNISSLIVAVVGSVILLFVASKL